MNSRDVVVCCGGHAHKFVNDSPGNLDIICIHRREVIQEDLE